MAMVPFPGLRSLTGMPAWLAAAVRMLIGTRAATALTAGTIGGAISDIPGVDVLPFIGGDGDGRPRRRRRRRALTASDRADIAFIAGMLGQPAGRQFAMLIGSRTAS